MRKLAWLAVVAAVLTLGCDLPNKAETKLGTQKTMKHIAKLDSSGIVYTDSSNYAGINGLRRFRECVGLGSVKPGRGLATEERLGISLPRSLFDLIEEGGSVSVNGEFGSRPELIGRLGEVGAQHLDYLKLSSRTVYDSDYTWHSSKKFIEEYHLRKGTNGTSLAPDTWYPSMLFLGEERSGALLLANPFVRSSDGEWEAWLWSHKFPGAYRFSSTAELVAHLYLEIDHTGNDNPRFEITESQGKCSESLFSDP